MNRRPRCAARLGGISILATYPIVVVHEADIAAVAAVVLTPDQERERLRGFGYDEDHVEFGVQLGSSAPEGSGTVLTTVADVTGRPARTFAQWARENADRFRG